MILAKTDKGRAALTERRALAPRERQLMVLADGKRSSAELAQLLGFAVDDTVSRLVLHGHLTRVTPPLRHAADFSPTGTVEFGPSRGVPADRFRTAAAGPVAAGPAPAAGAPAPAAPKTRRSLAGSKMYMIGLMQMLREAEASALAVALHGAQDADELRHWLVDSLVYLHQRSGADYAARVTSRVLEVFPEAALESLCQGLVQTQLPALAVLALAQRAALQAAEFT